MDSRKVVWVQTGIVALGQAICICVMIGVFVLLGHYDQTVLLGGIFGWLLSVLNFFFMAVGTNLAADKAEKQDVKGGKAVLSLSMALRYVVLFVLLFALAKSGLCNAIALALPLAFVRPVLTISEFFRKEGDSRT
jgi:hypothetical protein